MSPIQLAVSLFSCLSSAQLYITLLARAHDQQACWKICWHSTTVHGSELEWLIHAVSNSFRTVGKFVVALAIATFLQFVSHRYKIQTVHVHELNLPTYRKCAPRLQSVTQNWLGIHTTFILLEESQALTQLYTHKITYHAWARIRLGR